MNENKHCKASTDTNQDDKEPVKQVHLYLPLSLYKQLESLAKDDWSKTTPYIRNVLRWHVEKK